MAYYSTHGISQFLLNNEKQRVRFLLAHSVFDTRINCDRHEYQSQNKVRNA